MNLDLSKEFYPVPKNARIKNKKLLKEKKGVCEICGKKGQTEKHHVRPKGAGGNDTEENLIEVCRVCHRLIHDGKITKEEIFKIKEENNGKKKND